MTNFTNQLGLNITEEKLQLVEIAYKNNTFVLENVEEEYFDEALTFNTKKTKFIHILQNAYNEIVLRTSITTDKVSISLPLNFFKTFELPIDQNLNNNDLVEYIGWEFSQLFPKNKKDEFSFQPYIVKENNDCTVQRSVIYSISKSILKLLHKFCVRNNLQLVNVDNSHIAATTFIQANEASENQLSIFLDSNKISVALFNNNHLLYYKQKDYYVISEIAKTVKQIYNEILERNLIISSISKFFLSGNALSDELIKNIEHELDLTSELIIPFTQIPISPNFTNRKYLNGNSTKFSSAAGMAIRLVS